MYHFLSGFTSKLAGTERGITEPQPSFSTCFGAPFLPLRAEVYAELLGDLIDKHDVDVYLVNTGWTGGQYGVGNRIQLKYTRKMVNDAINGKLKTATFEKDDIFGLSIPTKIEDVPTTILQPKNAWTDPTAYEKQAQNLVSRFKENFKKFGEDAQQLEAAGGFKG